MIGKTLGHYRVGEQLGRGGMGEVYVADDLNLNRKVALKFLPNEFTLDPERMARFEREARLLASLNHHSIAAIYGLEQAEGKRFLALELVEGETLAQRLSKGPLPVEEALGICRQIAEGLETAHEKGVIHRDLKPANVMIAGGDKVKILDFGLAKALSGEIRGVDSSQSPTVTEAMTQPGVILGTAAYMSPEQAKGKSVDKRADIWAFGCILYECLTGKRPFEGETVTESLASILRGEPDWTALPATTPGNLQVLLRRCFQKETRLRLHDIADARIEIEDASTQPFESAPTSRRFSFRWLVAGAIVMLAVGIIAGIGLIKHFQQIPSALTVKATVKVEPGCRLGEESYWKPTDKAMAVAGSGRFVVYTAIRENAGPQAKQQIYLRRMDQMNAIPVAGTEGGVCPFLSPDDRWIGFWEGDKLKKVPVTGGIPTALCDVAWLYGADWGSDNNIIYSPGTREGLCRISSEGGQPEVLTMPEVAREERSHRLPHSLPNGRGVIFTIMANLGDMHPRLALLDLKTRKWRELMKDAADGRYLASGYLVFLRQGTLMAVAFDPDRLEIGGQPFPVLANVMQALNFTNTDINTGAGQYSISDSGALAYVPGGIEADTEDSLVHVDLKGNIRPVVDFKAPFFAPRFSPDGKQIAYHTIGKQYQLWIYDRASGSASRLISDGITVCSEWTRDGKHLVFNWSKIIGFKLYWQPADRSSPMERLVAGESLQYPGSFSPDGAILAFIDALSVSNMDIHLLDMKSRRVTPFINSQAWEAFPAISPDGRWMAYASNESGRAEVWVRPFPGQGGKWKISTERGTEPIWSKDGKQLYYRDANRVWAVDILAGESISAGKPRLLFERQGLAWGSPMRNWDLWPDGQGFIMVKDEEIKPQPVTEMILIQNWLEELKRLVSAK